jgi:UDP-N-acetylmuramate dehydrogenase
MLFNEAGLMEIINNTSLAPYNTFGIDAKASSLAVVADENELIQLLMQWQGDRPFILGGGSNILLTGDIAGLVIKNEIRGKIAQQQQDEKVLLEVGAGENWHELVCWTIDQGYGGLENLSLIPGTVGAAPIQNIGAYGVELEQVFHQLEAIQLETGEKRIFNHADCKFGYRSSVFKHELKGQFCITRVVLRLTTQNHRIATSYGAIRKMLAERHIQEPTPKEISEVVIAIRSSKLPDPKVLGNSGSFFKNPVIEDVQFEALKQAYPDIPHYPAGTGKIKLPAAWLIDQCGWKGKRSGDAGTYEKQALVLVNHGTATGKELWAFAQQIQQSVALKFGIRLQPEVNVL